MKRALIIGLDTSRAEKAFGFSAPTTLANGLAQTVNRLYDTNRVAAA
jgi:hypothetical protein